MSRRRKPKTEPAIEVIDVSEWTELAVRLKAACPQKHDEVLDALRKITEANELLAQHPELRVPNWERYEA